MQSGLQVRLLGALEVTVDGRAVDVSGSRLRGLLTRLAIDAPHVVTSSALIEALWPDEPPADETNALQSLVSRLRRALGDPALVAQAGAGYQLVAGSDDVDVHRFVELARVGREQLRAGDPAAAATLGAALALWRGPAQTWSDAAEAAAFRAGLEDQRLDATADRVEADLALGRAADVVAELDTLVARAPLRERLTALLMRALAATGRQSEALERYEALRSRLAEELGVDPSPELQAAHLSVLRGELATARATARPESRAHSNLRHALTSFVGREHEVARITKLLDEARLITLVGPGGAGKTRLATVAAQAATDSMPDGVWLAELAPVSDAGDVPLAVLDALGLRDPALMDRTSATGPVVTGLPTARLVDALATRDALVVLDNCEHVIDAAAQLANELLTRCPALRVVATSREPLGIVGETLVAVPPLGQPEPGVEAPEALGFPSVRLFADRAAAVSPGFEVTAHNVAAVVEIVRRLDGLPLAIELAAARLRALPVEEIAARLGDRFRLLTGGNRTALPRHRTLRAVVEWSWDLLTDDERLLAERLAVFAGSFNPPDAITVCADEALAAPDVNALLDSLVDRSLLQRAPAGARSSARYRMLETLREFGLERMAERDEVVAVRRRHAACFAALVAEAGPRTRSAEQLKWMARLDDDRENILAALRFLCDNGEAQTAVEMSLELATYWSFTGRHADAVTWLDVVLRAPGPVEESARLVAESFSALSMMTSDAAHQPEEVERKLSEIHEISKRLDAVGPGGHPFVAFMRPVMAMFSDRDVKRALELTENGAPSNDPWINAAVRMMRAAVAENNGDLAAMRADAELALAEFRAIGERWGLASCLGMLGQAYAIDDDLERAEAALEEALRLVGEISGHDDAMMLGIRLADIKMRKGDSEGARACLTQVPVERQGNGGFAHVFIDVVMAEVARTDGDLDQARVLRDKALATLGALPEVHPAQGHVAAMVYSLAAKLCIAEDDLPAAADQLALAVEFGIGSRDMPIIASVGVTAAMFALACGRSDDAARTLGAAARLRGGPDRTERDIAALTTRLCDALGAAEFDRLYAAGRALSPGAARKLVAAVAAVTSSA